MKKVLFLLGFSLAFFSCEKNDLDIENYESVVFSDYRQMEPANVRDYSYNEFTEIIFSGSSLRFNWVKAYQSQKLVVTRLLAFKSKTGVTVLMVGVDDICYSKLIILKDNRFTQLYDINMVKVIEAKIINNVLWIKYNYGWARTGKVPDEESFFDI